MARVALTDDSGALYGAPATWLGRRFALKGEAGAPASFAAQFPLTRAGDTPVVTAIARANSALATSGTLVRETRYTAADGFESMAKDDPSFRFDGSPELRRHFLDPTQYVTPLILPGGDSQNAYHNYAIETVTRSKEVELRLRVWDVALLFRVFVDGVPTTPNAMKITGLTSGSGYNLRIAFEQSKARHIKVMFGNTPAFGGVYIPTGESLSRPVTPHRLRAVIVGDSYEGGAGEVPGGGTRLDTGGLMASIMLGADSVWNYGIGGTGHVATAQNFITRIDEAVAANPNIVIVSGSINDGTQGTQAIRDAVAAELELLANVPEVYYTGPSHSMGYANNNTAVRETVLAAGRPYIDPLETGTAWITGLIGTDNSHPTWQGHQRRALKIYEGITKAREFVAPVAYGTLYTGTPTAPTTGAQAADTFTRADGTDLGATETGAYTWAATATGWTITSNEMRYASTAGVSYALAPVGTISAKHVVRATFAAPAGVAQALMANVNDTRTHGYALNRGSNNVYELRKLLSTGSFSKLADLPGVTAAAGDVGEIEFLTDGTIVARVNGVASTPVLDGPARGSNHGFYGYANHAARFDDFKVEILA